MAKRTITNRAEPRRSASRTSAYLVHALAYEQPSNPGSRHVLDGLATVELGRGDTFNVTRHDHTLHLTFDDPRMSQQHARLVRTSGTWQIEDRSSRNGTFVDGSRTERTELADNTIVELGRTAFVFRIGPAATATPLDLRGADLTPIAGIRTWSTQLAAQLTSVDRLARTPTSIVLHGETGTGKEVLARGLHVASNRRGSFVPMNCAALPANLIESELFGFKKGAFSGATDDRLGLVRAADGGTLFLDEVGDLPAQTQVALLRVLQEREVLPIGATRAIPVDLRVVSASHRDLEAAVDQATFREDLLARLAGFVVELPSLRARREDLGLLIATLLERSNAPHSTQFTPEAGLALMRHDWPRNIRELEQVLTTAVALAANSPIELEHLQLATRRSAPAIAEDFSPSDLKRRDQLRSLLATHRGNIAAVAREMKVARMQIHRWLERYQIDIEPFRAGP